MVGMFSALLALLGCDPHKIEHLQPGRATEADVAGSLGKPTAVYETGPRSRVLEFARAPEGQVTYFAEIDANGKLAKRIENVLVVANFARIRAGMTQDDVRRVLGSPSYVERYALKPDETIWTWRWLRNNSESMIFSAHFGVDQRVQTTSEGVDPRNFKG